MIFLQPCCVVMCGMLFVMYGSMVFSSILANVERSEMFLNEGSTLFLFGFEIASYDDVGVCIVL